MTNNFDCNDYSLLVANTGIAQISIANSSLTGEDAVLVISGAANGTIIKSIVIKAETNVLTGMVRFFIGATPAPPPPPPETLSDVVAVKYLYREIPIPTYPATPSISLPFPTWPMLEIDLIPGLKLQSGYSLFATTQVANTFNIIAEGVVFVYPDPLPTSCCNFKQETIITGVGAISADSGIVNLYTVTTGSYGAVIKSITVAALESTHTGIVRFYISPDAGTTYYLWMECVIPESIQSGFTPSLKRVLEEDFYLQADYIIAAFTQNAESFAITVEGEEWSYPI